MKRCVFAIVALAFMPRLATGATLFESSTLGPTGVSWAELASGAVPGTSVNEFVFPGVRFHLDQASMVTQLGGHFASPLGGTLFGAVVQLEGESDFPDSANLSSPDVLGAASLTFPMASAEVFGDLDLNLAPGWYALVFGTGLFGTDGGGGALRSNMDIGNPSYIAFEPNLGWHDLDGPPSPLVNHRFVVEGQVVPEPSSAVNVLLALILFVASRISRER